MYCGYGFDGFGIWFLVLILIALAWGSGCNNRSNNNCRNSCCCCY